MLSFLEQAVISSSVCFSLNKSGCTLNSCSRSRLTSVHICIISSAWANKMGYIYPKCVLKSMPPSLVSVNGWFQAFCKTINKHGWWWQSVKTGGLSSVVKCHPKWFCSFCAAYCDCMHQTVVTFPGKCTCAEEYFIYEWVDEFGTSWEFWI